MTSKRSTIIAITALVIAVFGSTPLGHAAGQLILPKASVGTSQLKASAVTGLKVKDGSLLATDFAAGQIPAGPKGDKGDKGDAGPAGMSGFQMAQGTITSIAPGATHLATVNCPAGKKAISGGFIGGGDGMATILSFPTDANGGGWYIRVKNLGALAATSFQAIAVCVNVS